MVQGQPPSRQWQSVIVTYLLGLMCSLPHKLYPEAFASRQVLAYTLLLLEQLKP